MGFSGKMIKALAPFIGMFAVIALFHFTDFVLLKYYPPIANFGFFAVFFLLCFRKRLLYKKLLLQLNLTRMKMLCVTRETLLMYGQDLLFEFSYIACNSICLRKNLGAV